MPPALIHCQSCRALLNPELETDSVVIPEFVPLQEIESMIEVEPQGHFIVCPACQEELKIAVKYVGCKVACKHCGEHFVHNTAEPRVRAFYSTCPHCDEQLRASMKYLDTKVACKHCNGHIHCVTRPRA